MCEALKKIFQYQWNLAHAEKNDCCYFAENYMQKYLVSKKLL